LVIAFEFGLEFGYADLGTYESEFGFVNHKLERIPQDE
jgi:hypothetical protein